MKRKAGVVLLVFTYALLLYMSLSAPAYARAHPDLDPALRASYAAPWPVALACTVALAGLMLALVPIRRGEGWARCTALAMLLILFITRLASDRRCLVVLDPHQHGCHTFMIAILVGIVGVGLAWR